MKMIDNLQIINEINLFISFYKTCPIKNIIIKLILFK